MGEGEVGKTTLTRKLKVPDFNLPPEYDTTRGIEVVRWEFPLSSDFLKDSSKPPNQKESNNRTFRVNMWDFGGQAIYHATHQFFLTKRSLYILVVDNRKESDDFYYWLNIVELLSDNSPLLIIKNEKQDRKRDINERQLRGRFTNLEKTLAANFANNRGLPEIIDEIKYQVCRLPHIGITLPKTWTLVRQTLEQIPNNYISQDEYLAICERYKFTSHKDKMQLSSYLHDLGVHLHFQDDPVLRRIIILNPEWGTAAVYKVLDNPEVVNNHGHFSRADLELIWHEEQYVGMQDELLQLMMKFKLCYQMPDNPDLYIAPQLLPADQPDYEWPETNNLELHYTYEFMPKGLLTQFIVATHPIANQYLVWKNGVILKKDEAAAEVIEHYAERKIKIRVMGRNQKELLTIVTWELDKIHKAYRGLKYDKLIPCNCTGCQVSQKSHFYPFEILRKFVNDQQQYIQCPQSYKMVNVLTLIDNVMERELLSLISVVEEIEKNEEKNTRPIRLEYDLRHVRTLLTEGFSEMDLRQFCIEEPTFKSLYGELSETAGVAHIVERILPYAERKELIAILLNWAKVTNPIKYNRFKPYMREVSR